MAMGWWAPGPQRSPALYTELSLGHRGGPRKPCWGSKDIGLCLPSHALPRTPPPLTCQSPSSYERKEGQQEKDTKEERKISKGQVTGWGVEGPEKVTGIK